MTRRLLLLPVLVLAAACSGGSDDADAKAAYLADAEAVCAKAVEAQKAAGTPNAPAAIPAFVRQVVTIASDASAELNALEPPEADAAELEEKFLGPLRQQVTEGQAFAKKVEDTAKGGDTSKVLALLGEAPLQAKADLEWMKSYGFTACVDAADTSS